VGHTDLKIPGTQSGAIVEKKMQRGNQGFTSLQGKTLLAQEMSYHILLQNDRPGQFRKDMSLFFRTEAGSVPRRLDLLL